MTEPNFTLLWDERDKRVDPLLARTLLDRLDDLRSQGHSAELREHLWVLKKLGIQIPSEQ